MYGKKGTPLICVVLSV